MDDDLVVFKTLLREVVHDIRNELSSILLYSELLGEANLDESSKENVNTIIKKGESTLSYLEALKLLYSDGASNNICDARQQIEKFALLFKNFFRARGKICFYRYCPQFKAELLKKNFWNFFKNVIKVSPLNEEKQFLMLFLKGSLSFYSLKEWQNRNIIDVVNEDDVCEIEKNFTLLFKEDL